MEINMEMNDLKNKFMEQKLRFDKIEKNLKKAEEMFEEMYGEIMDLKKANLNQQSSITDMVSKLKSDEEKVRLGLKSFLESF